MTLAAYYHIAVDGDRLETLPLPAAVPVLGLDRALGGRDAVAGKQLRHFAAALVPHPQRHAGREPHAALSVVLLHESLEGVVRQLGRQDIGQLGIAQLGRKFDITLHPYILCKIILLYLRQK